MQKPSLPSYIFSVSNAIKIYKVIQKGDAVVEI